MKDYILIKKKTAFGCSMAAITFMTAAVVLMFRHPSETRHKPAIVETMSYNILKANGKSILFFRDITKDSILRDADIKPDNIRYGSKITVTEKDLHSIVKRYKAFLNDRQIELTEKEAEMDYFIKRHNVRDEGFDMIAKHYDKLSEESIAVGKIINTLSVITDSTRLEISRKVSYEDAGRKPYSGIFVETDGGIWRYGTWLRTKREGKGISHDGKGNLICGTWNADTIVEGRRTDGKGTYHGHFNKEKEAEGHGFFAAADGTYYEGRWVGGLRNGFGFELGRSHMKAGEWMNGVYKGERISYTSERIYGIDISRYQHGKGRKYYPIYWNRLRITDLGRLSKKNVSGVVNYPVSFVYIKSTEGISIRNRYYAADYKQARKHGFHCGAYHFFSTKTSATAQARYFIRNSFFKKGDLPPVLDVEPTHKQIVKMGGETVLFNAIRTWMRIVRQHTGVKPVLYVSQNFVNKYLNAAPDIKKDYNIWIARYGEYKPDIKLIYWQLSPDGRVNGIHGDVDINVFNGYEDSFDSFIKTERIK
jgi:lysozyme